MKALFILYVDDLTKTLPQGTKHSLYVDDLTIWSSSPDPLKAAHSVQKALDHLEEWSLKSCLLVNPAKCECCFFNMDPHQASHQPQLTLTWHPPYIQPHFLVPQCYFWPNPLLKFFLRFKALRSIASASWVPPKSPFPHCSKHTPNLSFRTPPQDGSPSSVIH